MSRPTTARHTDKPTITPGQHPHQLWLQQTTKKSAQPHHHTKTGLNPQKLPARSEIPTVTSSRSGRPPTRRETGGPPTGHRSTPAPNPADVCYRTLLVSRRVPVRRLRL